MGQSSGLAQLALGSLKTGLQSACQQQLQLFPGSCGRESLTDSVRGRWPNPSPGLLPGVSRLSQQSMLASPTARTPRGREGGKEGANRHSGSQSCNIGSDLPSFCCVILSEARQH